MVSFRSFLAAASALVTAHAYWMGDMNHVGVAPFAPSGYKVFRNVRDYGAKGDGVSDDTAAINAAITDGSRCGQGCDSTTTTPAVVYFPSGTYLISQPVIPYYFTQMIGDAVTLPTLKATASFSGMALIDSDPYWSANPNWVTTNVFYKQIRNLVLDSTLVPAATAQNLLHWPTSQATNLQNLVFNMPVGSQHVGIFMESGSGGFLSDLTFNGGQIGARFGNQQFTMRNLVFNHCSTAISHFWSWGWTYMGISINNCQIGIDISAGGPTNVETGSITLIDSTIANTPQGILTAWTTTSTPVAAGAVQLENVAITNVPTMVQGPNGQVLAGTSGSTTIAAWAQGHRYWPNEGLYNMQGTFPANNRPSVLTAGAAKNYYVQSKPLYATLAKGDFLSVRAAGAKGDAATDDTAALQSAINSAVSGGKVLFIDHGIYRVTSTILIPAGAKIVGESFPVIMGSGSAFSNGLSPTAVIKVGANSGDAGTVALQDFIVSTQGATAGAILIEYNLASPGGSPAGMWDVHARVGGFTGSQLQVAQCPKGQAGINTACIAAYMSMHVTKGASGLYMENCWLWTADHDIDDAANTQITVYNGRGLYIESTVGTIWLVGTAVEHHTMYNYQFANTKNIFASQLQTETPYYQPIPTADKPFQANASLNDPTFDCAGVAGNCVESWGLRILDSSAFFIYGSNHYSFFNNYSTHCSSYDEGCQSRIVRIQGTVSNINIYSLNTIGSTSMIDRDGTTVAFAKDNVETTITPVAGGTAYPFTRNIAMYRI